MSATVMTTEQARGAGRREDGFRSDSQFGIAERHQSVTAAQVMQMVEAGGSRSTRRPPTTSRRTSTSTPTARRSRQLLDMHSQPGLVHATTCWRRSVDASTPRLGTRPRSLRWSVPIVAPVDEEFAAAVFQLQPAGARDAGTFAGGPSWTCCPRRPRASAERSGSSTSPKRPRAPMMAMPDGESGQRSRRAAATSHSSPMRARPVPRERSASDSRYPSPMVACVLRRRARFASLDDRDVRTFVDAPGYGLGLFNPTDTYARVGGSAPGTSGYVSWAGCLLDEGAVIVVLSDVEFDDIGGDGQTAGRGRDRGADTRQPGRASETADPLACPNTCGAGKEDDGRRDGSRGTEP